MTDKDVNSPLPSWSHLDRFKWTFMVVGEDLSSTAMSPHAKCEDGSNEFCVGTVILRNHDPCTKFIPKTQRGAAAQIVTISAGTPGDLGFQ